MTTLMEMVQESKRLRFKVQDMARYGLRNFIFRLFMVKGYVVLETYFDVQAVIGFFRREEDANTFASDQYNVRYPVAVSYVPRFFARRRYETSFK